MCYYFIYDTIIYIPERRMFAEKGNTQALFHFLLSELIVECSEHTKGCEEESVDNKMR